MACFTCKVPEIRAIFFIVATLTQLFEQENFDGLFGNVTQKCMLNQSYLPSHMCGPRGAEQLPFSQWKRMGFTAYRDANHDLVQSYAYQIEKRAKEMGGASSGDGEFASLAAAAWFERDQTLTYEQQPSLVHWHM